MKNCERCGQPIVTKRVRKEQRFCGRDCSRRSIKHSVETREKMSRSAKKRIAEKPHTIPPHVGQQPFLGRSHTPETRAKMAASKTGAKNPMYGKTGEAHHNWTGDKATYGAVHDWMSDTYGQPIGCEVCGTEDPSKRYEWANLSGHYRRDRADFKRMCKGCHNDHDGVNAYQIGEPARKNRPQSVVKKGVPVSSRYKGVRASGYGTWRASFFANGHTMNLGSFPTEEAAARAYNEAASAAHGEDTYLNRLDEP